MRALSMEPVSADLADDLGSALAAVALAEVLWVGARCGTAGAACRQTHKVIG